MLKQRVRDHLDPARDLGHSDRHPGKGKEEEVVEQQREGADEQEKAAKTATGETPSAAAIALATAAPGPAAAPAVREVKPDVKLNPDGSVCGDCE